jgi:DNA polymerase V
VTAGPAPRRLVALVDCRAFYCSCERVFDPALAGVPVVVLSNNDGCVISRSAEAKRAGVRMGAPYFQEKGRLAAIGCRVFSSNYTLYADMSRRVMATLETATPDVEVYSIDEAFLTVPTPPGSPAEARAAVEAWGLALRDRVMQWTGVPVRVAIATTKTLAKAASVRADEPDRDGVHCLWGDPDAEAFLARMPVTAVWGLARRSAARLPAGAQTAGAFAALPDREVRQRLGVVGLRTAYELRGVSCLPLDRAPTPRHSLVRSRSFGRPVTDVALLREAVATHAARAAEKLRAEGLAARAVGAFVSTKGIGDGPHRTGSAAVALGYAANRTPEIIRAALLALARAHEAADRAGRPFRYRKAGVTLWDIGPAAPEQAHLFRPPAPEQDALHASLDALNRRFGSRTVFFASMGTTPRTPSPTGTSAAAEPAWAMRRALHSPRYTTRWDEIARVRS